MKDIIHQDCFVSGIDRLKKGDEITYDADPKQVFNFYINGRRVENRGQLLQRILHVNRSNKKKSKMLAVLDRMKK